MRIARCFIILLASVGAVASAVRADVVSWLDGFNSVAASWSGGAPINGDPSWSDYTDSVIDGYYGAHVLAAPRNTAAINSVFYTNPNPTPPFPATITLGGLDDNNTFNYNGFSAPGVPDPSLRTFSMTVVKEFVFSTSEDANVFVFNIPQDLASWTHCLIESGTYSGGVFTPSGGSIDLLPLAPFDLVALPAGHYRYRSAFSTTFDRDTGFSLGTGAVWRIQSIPAPASTVFILLGVSTLNRRPRRCLTP